MPELGDAVMFKKMLDELKNTVSASLRSASLAAAAALTGVVTLGFLCAAAFVHILDRYGPIEACLAGAGAFFVVTLALVVGRLLLVRRAERRAAAKSAMKVALTDPMVIAAGLQVIRAVGIKRLVPLVALAGIALGLMARSTRPTQSDQDGK